MANHLTPEELSKELGIERQEVIRLCIEEGVPIYQGKIDKYLFQAQLEAKLAGQEIVAPEPVAEAPVIDLMEALRQSVADAQTRRSAEGSRDGKARSKAGSRSRKTPAKKSA